MSYTKKSLEMLDLDSNYSAISKAIPKGSGVEPSGSQQATPRNSGQRFTLASLTEQSNKVIGKIMSLSSLFDPKLEKCDGQDMDIVIVSPTTRNSKRMSTAFTAQQNDFQISTAKVSDYSLDPPSVDIHKMGLKSPKISSPLVSRGKSNSNDYDEAGEIRKSDSVESLASLPIMPHANSYAKKYGSRLLHKRPSTELSSICSLSPSKGHRKLVPAMIQTGCRRPSMFEKMNLRPSQDEIVSNLDKFFPDILNYEVCTPNPLRSPTNQVLIITKTESVISGQSSARSSAASHPKANPSPLSQATFFPDGAYASTSHEKLSTGTRTSRKQSIASATSSHHSRKQSLASDSSTPNSDGDRGAMAVGSPKISLIEVLRQEITKKKGRRTTVSMRMGQPRDSGMNSGVTPTSSMFFATSVVSKFPPILSLNLSVAEMPEEVVTYPAVQDGCASAVPNDNGATINDNGNEVDAKTSQIREQLITKAQQSIEDDADDKMVAWYKGDRIGRGAYGAVYLAINLKSWELMAVKQVENAVLNKLKIGSSGIITHEMEILESLNHPNIVAYKDNARFEKEDTLTNLFLEYVPGGSLASTLKRTGQFPEQLTRCLSAQIFCGLKYLHSQGIIHHDIKADNSTGSAYPVLITQNGECKISDFGISKKTKTNAYRRRSSTSQSGTPNWMAPEIIKKKGYSAKVDVWAAGCTILEMATGEKPWKGYDMVLNIFSKLSQNQVPPLQGVQDVETLRFVKICLESDPEIRPGAEDLLLDPYLMVDPYSYQYATFVKDSMLKREQKLVTESSEGETDTDEHESD